MLNSIFRTPQFKRDFKALMRKHYDEQLFIDTLKTLMKQDEQLLKTKYSDHALKGNWKGFREIHITPDWLLIYRIDHDVLQLVLTRTGSHNELF